MHTELTTQLSKCLYNSGIGQRLNSHRHVDNSTCLIFADEGGDRGYFADRGLALKTISCNILLESNFTDGFLRLPLGVAIESEIGESSLSKFSSI